MILDADRQEQPRKLLMPEPWLASAKDLEPGLFHGLKRLPLERAVQPETITLPSQA
jgi:hypothetical protein